MPQSRDDSYGVKPGEILAVSTKACPARDPEYAEVLSHAVDTFAREPMLTLG